jgi:hypothetical protein
VRLRIARKIEKRCSEFKRLPDVPYRDDQLAQAEIRLRRSWQTHRLVRVEDGRTMVTVTDDWLAANRMEIRCIRIRYFPRRGGVRVYEREPARPTRWWRSGKRR